MLDRRAGWTYVMALALLLTGAGHTPAADVDPLLKLEQYRTVPATPSAADPEAAVAADQPDSEAPPIAEFEEQPAPLLATG